MASKAVVWTRRVWSKTSKKKVNTLLAAGYNITVKGKA